MRKFLGLPDSYVCTEKLHFKWFFNDGFYLVALLNEN